MPWILFKQQKSQKLKSALRRNSRGVDFKQNEKRSVNRLLQVMSPLYTFG